MSAATLEPGPPRAAYGPDASLRLPIRTTPSEIWACAGPGARLSAVMSVTRATQRIGGRSVDRVGPDPIRADPGTARPSAFEGHSLEDRPRTGLHALRTGPCAAGPQ